MIEKDCKSGKSLFLFSCCKMLRIGFQKLKLLEGIQNVRVYLFVGLPPKETMIPKTVVKIELVC